MKGAGKDTEDLEALFTVDTKGSRPSTFTIESVSGWEVGRDVK